MPRDGLGSVRPLVVRCGAFGDMVLVMALIRDLTRRFGRPVDVLTSGSWSEPLLSTQSVVGDIICVRSRKAPYWLSVDQRRAVASLRRRGIGPTWLCDGNDAAASMVRRAGIDDAFIVDVAQHPLLTDEHATQQWRRLANIMPAALAGGVAEVCAPAASVGAAPGGCQLDVSAEQQIDLDHWLRGRGLLGRPIIAIQAGNKRTMRRGLRRLAVNNKYWPNERWAASVRHVRLRCPEHVVVLLGTGPEFELNQQIMAMSGCDGVYNGADGLPIPRLVALLARAAGMITVDSGPAHAAAAVGCPVVVLFGKASTSLYRPWGSGGDVKVVTGEVGGQPDMLGIDTPAVTAAWDALTLRQA